MGPPLLNLGYYVVLVFTLILLRLEVVQLVVLGCDTSLAPLNFVLDGMVGWYWVD